MLEIKKWKYNDKNVLNYDEGAIVKTNTWTHFSTRYTKFVLYKLSLKTTSTDEAELLLFEIKNKINIY